MHAIVEVTTASEEESRRIGRQVVEERLAACANIIPTITSCFWWKGKLEEDSESILLLKTTRELVTPLIERVRALHSYENPAIVALPIEAGSSPYLNWIDKETRE